MLTAVNAFGTYSRHQGDVFIPLRVHNVLLCAGVTDVVIIVFLYNGSNIYIYKYVKVCMICL